MFMTALITLIGAYLIGSVNFAVIFTKAFAKIDVRKVGSGNAGATNALRSGGTLAGLLTFLCDAAKGALGATLGYFMFLYIYKKTGSAVYLPIYGGYACGVATMIGHVFPVFFGFKGGKGVATGVGSFFALCPIAAAVGLLAFIVSVVFTKLVSLSSIIGTLSVVILSLFLYSKSYGALFWPQAIMGLIMGAIIIIKHIPNIKRLLNGEESKIAIRRK